MAQTNQGDYLDDLPYLTAAPYMGGTAEVTTGMQAEMVIDDDQPTGMQAEMRFPDQTNSTGMQATMFTGGLPLTGMQAKMVAAITRITGMQADMVTQALAPTGMQALMKIVSPDDDSVTGMQAKMGQPAHVICGGYLDEFPYLEDDPYLGPRFCTLNGMQAEMIILLQERTGMQADQQIVSPDDDSVTGMQALMQIIENSKITGMQADMLEATRIGMQATMVIYSIETLRFLCDFASRGTPAQAGITWTSVQAIEAGDFSPNNLNTDIFEQRTQVSGTPVQWELRCDTGVTNTFVDTIYIGEHNFTQSASVVFQASTVSNFASIEYERTLTVEQDNIYFILPVADFPAAPARYYRLIIQDPTNINSMRIGIVLFGTSVIFGISERFLNPVQFGFRHFKDTIETEGFTNVSNDRAIRKFLKLDFEQLLFDGQNFEKIRELILTAKTDLKCLIIPRPTRPSSLAVFAKLVQLPEEQHYATEDENHRIDLSLEWDETE
jgi:hypothetical protein